jgi:hypothetical protein
MALCSLGLAGCGAAGVTLRTASSPSNARAARADARSLVGSLRLPATATRSSGEPAGDDGLLAEPGTGLLGTPGEVNKTSFWIIAASKQRVLAFVKASRPAGSRLVGLGGSGPPGGPTTQYEEFASPAVPHVLLTRQLVVELASLADGRTGVRADAEVIPNVPSATAAISAQRKAAKSVLTPLELAIAKCVRTHGVPNFPEPNSHGVLPLARTGSPLAQKENTAIGICAHLLDHPTTPVKVVGRRVPAQALRRFSACAHAHGLPGYPNPGASKKAAATYTTYIRKHLGEFRRAVAACSGLLPLPPTP